MRPALRAGLLGLSAGLLFSLVGCGLLVAADVMAAYRALAAEPPPSAPPAAWSATPTPSPSPTPSLPATATASPTPVPPTRTAFPTATELSSLAQAERYLDAGRAQDAVDQAQIALGQLVRPEEMVRAYTVLAEAELDLGHYQLAAGYYERVYALAPSAELLLEMAMAYDIGGDLDLALARYLQLLDDWSAPGLAELRVQAQAGADHIISVIGTPTPGPRP